MPASKTNLQKDGEAEESPGPILGKETTFTTPVATNNKQKKSKREDMDDMSLAEALALGPPPLKVQIEETAELLEELLNDEAAGNLTKKKVESRLNEAIYILEHLKMPAESLEDQASRLAQAVVNSGDINKVVVNDSEVQKWMSSNFGAHSKKKNSLGFAAPQAVQMLKVFKSLSEKNPEVAAKRLAIAKARRILLFEPMGANATLEQKRAAEDKLDALARVYHSLGGFVTNICLASVEKWEFDVFRFSESTNERPLTTIMMHLVHKMDLLSPFHVDRLTFARFVSDIEAGYNPLPYHNKIHATDVVQNIYYFLSCQQFKSKLEKRDLLGALLAACIHDYKHPGRNNNFLRDTEHETAILYNDRSILENMHIAEAFALMQNETHNIFANTDQDDIQQIRATIIQMVLGTDMQFHFSMLANLQTRIAEQEAKMKSGESNQKDYFEPPERKDLLLLMETALHCADLGNPSKPKDIMLQWTARVTEEFFQQGDEEKALGLPISAMMDRTKPNVAKSQVGFIDVIVSPLYRTVEKLIPEGLAVCMRNLEENKRYWLADIEQARTGQTPVIASRTIVPLTLPNTPKEVDHRQRDKEELVDSLIAPVSFKVKAQQQQQQEQDKFLDSLTSPRPMESGPPAQKT